MSDLLIFRQPAALISAHDVLSSKSIAGLNRAGISCSARELTSQWWAEKLWFSKLPGRRTFFEYGPALAGLLRRRRQIRDVRCVWINGPASPLNENCWFERSIVKAGKPYIFHLQDDWFSEPSLRDVAVPRVRLASLVVVPTDPLRERILGLFPDAKVLVLEEPIDVERVRPVASHAPAGLPFFVWTGHVSSIADFKEYAGILDRVYARHPFKLRIISGQNRPQLTASFPWEWFQYDRENESEYLAGAAAGLAPLNDGPYARCKGGYKVKTYLTAGVPTVASPVGHHTRMIRSGENGILARTPEEWESALVQLLQDPPFATRLGEAGRASSEKQYSHEVLMPVWASELQKFFPSLRG